MNSLEQPTAPTGVLLHPVVSVLHGELKLSGCENHPHRLDLSCCKIRKTDGTALTTKQVWEVLSELSDAAPPLLAAIKRLIAANEALGAFSENAVTYYEESPTRNAECQKRWFELHGALAEARKAANN